MPADSLIIRGMSRTPDLQLRAHGWFPDSSSRPAPLGAGGRFSRKSCKLLTVLPDRTPLQFFRGRSTIGGQSFAAQRSQGLVGVCHANFLRGTAEEPEFIATRRRNL